MSDRNKRLDMLGQHFPQQPEEPQNCSPADHGGRRKGAHATHRKRHSVYLDEALMERIDFLFKEVQHEIYPVELKKSTFLEMLLERGLDDLDSIKNTLSASRGHM